MAACFALFAVQAQAQPGFALLTPTAGELVPAGQPVTVTWTGGDPSWSVNVLLIDQATNTVVYGFGVAPNTGSRVVTIPNPCGHTYLFYIENSPRTTWTYGSVFTVVCSVSIADGDVAALIAAINAANANPGPDIINLAPNGNYVLTAVAEFPAEHGTVRLRPRAA